MYVLGVYASTDDVKDTQVKVVVDDDKEQGLSNNSNFRTVR